MTTTKKKRGWNGGMRPSTDDRERATLLGYISTSEAAKIANVAISTVSSWITAGKLPQVHPERVPTMKVGSFRWVYRDSLLAYKNIEQAARGESP